MTAFFSRFRRLISAISGACRRHSSGVTCAETFFHTDAVADSTALVKAKWLDPSAMASSLCSL